MGVTVPADVGYLLYEEIKVIPCRITVITHFDVDLGGEGAYQSRTP